MVKHIVLFQLDPEMESNARLKVMQAFKEGIEALPEKIACIRKIEGGLNINSEETFDIALYSEFDTLEDVKEYAKHPAHLAVAALLRDCKKSRSCVDYECKTSCAE